MPPRAPQLILAAHLGERTRGWIRACCHRALNKTAAEHARLARGRVVEHAGLPGRDALLARDELNRVMAVAAAQPGRLRRAGRAHPHEDLETASDGVVKRTVADPIDVAPRNAIPPPPLARPHHDP